MKPKHKAIIFDLDGTLLNSLADLANAVNRVMLKHNFPIHEINTYRYFIGDGAKMLITRALPEQNRNEQLIEECLDEFKKDYENNWHIESTLYPAIPEMLDSLSERGIRLAVLSNKPHEFTLYSVEYFLSEWKFEVVLGQKQDFPKKPDPAGALLIAEKMQLSPAAFCYAGDSGVDMQTASASAMFSIGVLWGYRPAQELQSNGANVLANTPVEILEFF
jgi:phosphoglycolate phosphatase